MTTPRSRKTPRRIATGGNAPAPTPASPPHNHDEDYAALLASVRETFRARATGPLFITSVPNLPSTYLLSLPAEQQIHTCSTCRHFLSTYGGLATIDDQGRVVSALWNPATVPPFYRAAVEAMAAEVRRAQVTGVFLSSSRNLGTPVTGPWTHFAVIQPTPSPARIPTPTQAMAAKREDFRNVSRALAAILPVHLREAIRILSTGHLANSDKFIAPLQWLLDLHTQRAAARTTQARANLLWRAIATAPEGYCHPRAAVTGTLLEDLAAGMDFPTVKARWDAKVHPLLYQRPQAPPKAGNLAEAEKIAEKLGIGPSLARRFARLDECHTLWLPKAASTPASTPGLFSHLQPRPTPGSASRPLRLPPTTMTWEKFARTILPYAEKIEAQILSTMNFLALTTAKDPLAPPILKWDHEHARNPVAWYVYPGGSAAATWNLRPGWTPVTAVVPLPTLWGNPPSPHLAEGVVIVLAGCRDLNTTQGNALFPETLIPVLHPIRATIEAYSKRAALGGRITASACGLDVRKGMTRVGYCLRVTTGGAVTDYTIDRWD